MTILSSLRMDVVYEIYGISLMILGVVAFLLPQRTTRLRFSSHLWLLGLFAILHGIGELIALEEALWLDRAGLLLEAVSYAALMELGRRAWIRETGHRAWLSPLRLYPVVAVAVAAMTITMPAWTSGLDAGLRYFLGMPGALLTGLGLLSSLRRLPQGFTHTPIRFWLAVAAIAMLAYSGLNLLISGPTGGLWTWLPSQADYLSTFGLSVQIPLSVATLAAALALVLITRETSMANYEDLEQVLATINGFVYRCRNDEEWSVIYLNGDIEGVTGYPLAHFQRSHETPGRGIHPEDRQHVSNGVKRALQERREFELSYRIITRGGEVRRVHDRGEGVLDDAGELLFLQGHVIDATELTASRERLERAEERARLGHWELEIGSGTGYWSRQMYRLFNLSPEREVPDSNTFLQMVHPEDRETVSEAFQAMAMSRNPPTRIFRSNPEHGPVRHFQPTWQCIMDHHGRPRSYSGTLQDITEYQRTFRELQEAEAQQRQWLELARREQGRMAALLSAMSIGILFEDREGCIEYINPAFLRMWAIDESARLIGRPTREVLEHSTHQFARPDHASRHVLQILDTHEISERYELDLYDGRIFTQLSYPVSEPDGRILGRLWIYEDITHERQTAQQLVYLAEHDPLTGLYNRHRFQEQLNRMIRSARRSGGQFAVLYFDLDDFKYINDSFGHRAGDTVLVRTAGEIASLVRSDEMFARLGGDEFAILTETTNDGQPSQIANRIAHTISSIPFRFRSTNLRLTTSIGITLYPEHGDNSEDLVAHADTAMYQAKYSGKNTWALYDPDRDISEAMVARMTWTNRIARALEQELLELHFQGIYHTGNRRLSHLEALVRMRDPGNPGQLIMPGQFIPVAEKSGHILEIDRWVLARSIGILADHPELPGLAVNVSGRSFDDPALPRFIRSLLDEHDVQPRRLIIELTETAAVTEMQDAQRFIEALQKAGCIVCLDDFGTGFSTFAYLKYLAVQMLKIDGMFIRDLPDHKDNQAFVKAMKDVGHGLNKLTVAEFVEDEATLQMLHAMGVELAQGYHLDRPSAEHPALNRTPLPSED